jgi:hypothetical protein
MVSASVLMLAALRVPLAALRLALATLLGALAPVTLGVAAVAAAAAVAPAVAMSLTEGFGRGLAGDGRLCGLAATEQALQPGDESSLCRLWRRSRVFRGHAVLTARARVVVRARVALRLVATEVASILARGVGLVLPAIGSERGSAVVPRMVRAVAEMGVPPRRRGRRRFPFHRRARRLGGRQDLDSGLFRLRGRLR